MKTTAEILNDTADLIAETAYIKSEDVRQEYLTLRLEGHTTQQATAKAGRSRPRWQHVRLTPSRPVSVTDLLPVDASGFTAGRGTTRNPTPLI
jgi:chorismate mutase